jgi:hypothetical protein
MSSLPEVFSKRFRNTAKLFCLSIFCLTLIPLCVSAEENAADESKAEDTKFDVLKPGVVASFGRASKHAAVDSLATGSVPGDEAMPVTASVAKVKSGKCEVKLSNSDEKNSYSVSYVVEGINSKGDTVMKRSYSATLDPKKTVTNALSCRDDLNLQVVLRSGKKLK